MMTEKSNRKAWNIACHGEGNEDLWKIRCLPGMLRLFERKEQPDSIDHYLKLGEQTTTTGTIQLHRCHRIHTIEGSHRNKPQKLCPRLEGLPLAA